MTHPYRAMPDRAFWKRAVSTNWDPASVAQSGGMLRPGDRVASAGSCFAANIVPFLERAGFVYVRTETVPECFAAVQDAHFSYAKFSAAYGNIYTPRQALQLLQRAQGRFTPAEDRWVVEHGLVVDPYRPGLKYPAASHAEFDALTAQHLAAVRRAIAMSDVFVFTLGLTEAWASAIDGAVFPACPGTVAGEFDPDRHRFRNFTVAEIGADLDALIEGLREINPRLRIILTVSPVPLVATATGEHVLVATMYSKSVLRAAAGEACSRHEGVSYFVAYEIVTGPQAPHDYFEPDRREPSAKAVAAVMTAFLGPAFRGDAESTGVSPDATATDATSAQTNLSALSRVIADAECEEAAAGL